jgi:hypothetical protein
MLTVPWDSKLQLLIARLPTAVRSMSFPTHLAAVHRDVAGGQRASVEYDCAGIEDEVAGDGEVGVQHQGRIRRIDHQRMDRLRRVRGDGVGTGVVIATSSVGRGGNASRRFAGLGEGMAPVETEVPLAIGRYFPNQRVGRDTRWQVTIAHRHDRPVLCGQHGRHIAWAVDSRGTLGSVISPRFEAAAVSPGAKLLAPSGNLEIGADLRRDRQQRAECTTAVWVVEIVDVEVAGWSGWRWPRYRRLA